MGNCLCGGGGAAAAGAREMLAPAGLEAYAGTLARASFDRQEALEGLCEADLRAVKAFSGQAMACPGGMPPGHRKGILQAARRYAAEAAPRAAPAPAALAQREADAPPPAPAAPAGGEDPLPLGERAPSVGGPSSSAGGRSLEAAASVMDTVGSSPGTVNGGSPGGGSPPPPGWDLPSGICSPRPSCSPRPRGLAGREVGDGTGPSESEPESEPEPEPEPEFEPEPEGGGGSRPPRVHVPPLQLHRARSLELEEVGGAVARRVEALRASLGSQRRGGSGGRGAGAEDAPALRPPVAASAGSLTLRQSLDATGAEIRERVARLRQANRAGGGGAEGPGGRGGAPAALPRQNSPPVVAR